MLTLKESEFKTHDGTIPSSLAYIGARLIWGTYKSYLCVMLLFGPKADPRVGNVRFVYGGINIMLVRYISAVDLCILLRVNRN